MLKFMITSTTLFVLATVPALAQQVIGVTSTQAVVHYQAPNAADCQVKVSRNSSMTPLAYDVDPVLFPGSDLDSRTGNVISPSKTDRYFVIGRKRADVASDGKRYSRALQAFSEYFYQVSCSGNVQSGRFVTANPPLGNDYPEPPPFDATAFGNYAWPTIDWNDQSRSYIDPMTGILLKRATGPGWYGQRQTGKAFALALDVNALGGIASGWTNVANILSGSTSNKASYTGAGGDPIFLAFDPAVLIGNDGEQFATWSGSQTLDNILLRVFGTGTGTVSACLSDDSGGHCASPAVNIADLHSSGGNPAGTFPAACASEAATNCFPNYGYWGGWNFTPMRGQVGAYAGQVNVAGSAVTAGSNTRFDLNWKPGGKVSIAGTAPACPNNLCTISLVNSSSTMTIVEFAPTLSNAVFKTANSGVMVWINRAGSTYAASISVNFDYTYSDQAAFPLNGTFAQCSSRPTTVSYAADGVTPITPVAGELCLENHRNIPGENLYLFIPSTGETRFLSPLYFANPQDPDADKVTLLRGLQNAFDASDPNTFYVQATVAGGKAEIYSATYNAAVYKYRTYSHSLYPSVTDRYAPGQDVTQPFFKGPAWPDTGITWVNLTRASQNKDLLSQVAANAPNWDPTIFGAPLVTRAGNGKAIVVDQAVGYGETINLINAVDLATGTLYAAGTSYGTYPARWCAVHSDILVEGWYGLICNPLGGAYGWHGNSSLIGIGPWQMTPTAVLKGGTFSTDTSLTATSPRDACPAIPSFLTSVVPANPGCVTFRSEMACSHTPNAAEKLKWPCETNPAWSELQQVAPGDGLLVLNGNSTVETLLVISVKSLGAGNYEFTAVRGTTTKGARVAPNGWTAYAVPPLTDCSPLTTCTPGFGLWYKLTDTTFQWRGDPRAFGGHSDLGNGPKPGTNNYCITGLCRYNVPFEQQIGDQFATAKIFGEGSFAGVPGKIAMQGYPSLHQLNAPPAEQVWMANYRHLNPSFGAGGEVAAAVGKVAYSLLPGTRGVYKFTSISGDVHYKQVPVIAYAGYHLLKEISSPATGDIITDSTPWKYCVVLKAGECRSGSAVNEVYVSVPQGLIDSSQNCISNWYDDNYPCVFTPPAKAGFIVQEGISKDDPNGTNWRRITMGLSGYGRQYEFATFIPDPTGSWGFTQGYWLDGVRNDLLIAKLPPWPNPQEVTVNRTNFIPQSVQIGANQNLTGARVRFGYTENGNVNDFFCTARQEACVTAGSASSAATPYWFIGENQGWQPCTSGCTISVPAIPGRVLFYAVDRQDGAGNTIPGTPQVVVVR